MIFYRLNRIPVKRRARVTKSGHAYTDEKTKADLQAVKDAYTGKCYKCPVEVVVIVYKDVPKTTPKSVLHEPFTQRPDIDNILKAVLDGLNGVAYEDDSQVVRVTCRKMERMRGAGEYCKFTVFPARYCDGTNKY